MKALLAFHIQSSHVLKSQLAWIENTGELTTVSVLKNGTSLSKPQEAGAREF